MAHKNPREISPIEVYFGLVGGKYKATIIWYLAQKENQRFGEISKRLPKNSSKSLANQLRAMETDGLIIRTVYPEIPPRVEYSLTPLGYSLYPSIQQAHMWAINYVNSLPNTIAPITSAAREIYENPYMDILPLHDNRKSDQK